ncbi:RmlC-like cupin domain-containing protein [Geranomyces variabilis]|nr:RmlC-like cupin domain-containing protein [Geranomyces variabilis]KAJ3140782.1 hypothetical protein HDU90_008087 [Geranomyces variabilis]
MHLTNYFLSTLLATAACIAASPAPAPVPAPAASPSPSSPLSSLKHPRRMNAQTEVERMSGFKSKDYVLDLFHNPKGEEVGKGGKLSRMNLKSLPALDRQNIALTLILLEPCGANLPHTHPRASEALYVINGEKVLVGVIEENGSKVILNNLDTGKATFVPQGALHFEQNLTCEPAVLIAANPSEDPGTLTIASEFWMLPDGTLEASLGVDEREVRKIRGHIPMGPSPGSEECRKRCGLDKY